jgi:hypothetical protein
VLRRIGIGCAIAFVVWLVVLVVLDFALAGRQARHVEDRFAESLQATAAIGDSNLSLVRGRLVLDNFAIRRDDTIGHLSIDVAEIRCELAPLGWALIDSSCSELAVKGTKLEVSTAALFKIKNPKRKPVHADHVVIDDATLAFSPSAFVPDLGKIAIHIDHAETGATTFRTPLSWLLSLTQLKATVDLPADITVHLEYGNGVLSATGTLFGSTPVTLPVTLPSADAVHDAHEEIVALVALGKQLAESLVAKRAEDWLKQKLSP